MLKKSSKNTLNPLIFLGCTQSRCSVKIFQDRKELIAEVGWLLLQKNKDA